uniref:(California timema) hypothetical protein n=1 Tax=Timema californicum TaxID=61474 RepID=A0A7R9IXU7_TIMCA|nr:unnamed protein product [Timema californicum]
MEESEGWGVTLYEVLEGQLRLVDWQRAAFSLSGNSGQSSAILLSAAVAPLFQWSLIRLGRDLPIKSPQCERRLVDTSVPVFTGKIRTPRKIRALTSTAVFIEFVAQPSNDTQYTGFTLTFQKYGEITTSTETSTEASTLPVAPQSVNAEFTVYLSGLTPVLCMSTPLMEPADAMGDKCQPLFAPVPIIGVPKPDLGTAQQVFMKEPRVRNELEARILKTAATTRSRLCRDKRAALRTHKRFAQNITEFKTAVKGMAVSFCTVNNINIIDNITEKNVIISYAVQCPITWPNSHKCVQVTMSIPVVVLNDTAYEMTTIHLYQMWNQYSARDTLLQELGLKVYSVPRTEVTMYTWMGVSLGCLAIFAIILVMVWRLDIFANHSDRSSGVSESQPKMSTTSQKSWIELPYQEFPPMGVDDFPEYEPDNLHTGKGAHINLHPLPSPTPKLPSYGPPQEYGAALHFFPTSFDNQALIEEDDEIYQKHDRNTSTS